MDFSGNALMKAKGFYFRGYKATFPGGGGCGRRDLLSLTVSFLKQILHRLLSSNLNEDYWNELLYLTVQRQKIDIQILHSFTLQEGKILVDLGTVEMNLGVMSSSFSSGGATFIFPNTSVYPEATQRIATRPGMNNNHFLCAVILLISSLEISHSFSLFINMRLYFEHTHYILMSHIYVSI